MTRINLGLETKRRDRDIQGFYSSVGDHQGHRLGPTVCQLWLRDTAVYDQPRLVSACARYLRPTPLSLHLHLQTGNETWVLRRVGFSCYAITIVYAYTTSCHRWLYHPTLSLGQPILKRCLPAWITSALRAFLFN
jgi:hypothetical protein